MGFKRKIFILILGIISVLSLALVMTGCGSSSSGTYNSNYSTNNSASHTITILNDAGETISAITLTDQESNNIKGEVSTSRTGYEFLGYYTSDGIQIFDANGKQASGIIIDHDYTLYLRYSVKTYTFIYYVYNDDSGKYEVYKEQSYDYDTELVSLENAPSKTGYDFVGWAKTSSGNSLYSSGTTPTNSVFNYTNYTLTSEDEVELYAKYEKRTLTITLVYNNSSLNESDVTIEVEYGSTLPDLSSYYITDDGKEMMGWSKYSYQYTEYTSIITNDITLYGYWLEYKYITLVYTETESVAYKVYNITGQACTLPSDTTIPGKTLEGWYTNKTLMGNPVTSASFNMLADTYYAKWNLATYTITFVYDGEYFADITYTIESSTITLPEISLSGYNFYGWCTDEGLTSTPITKVVPSTSKGGYGDMVLYPKLEKYSSTITYYVNSTKLGTLKIEYGEYYTIPVSSSKFGTGTDKEFEYWYMEDDDGKLVVLTDDDGNSLTTWDYLGSSYYVYAEYEQLYSVTLSYTNPSTGKTVSDNYGYYHVGDELTINAGSYSNYSVAGYYINGTLISTADYFTYTVEAYNATITATFTYKIAKEFTSEYGFPYTVYSYSGHYYALVSLSKTWSAAESWCEFYGGHLVTITTSGEQAWLAEIMAAVDPGNYSYHIGGYYSNGAWHWVTGETFSYTNWHSGEPSSSSENYICFYSRYTDYTWNDGSGSSSYYVIEWDSSSDYVTTVKKTLDDVNGSEVTLMLYKYNNHYYAVVDSSVLWTAAETYAEYLGGHLAVITSSSENDFVASLIAYASKSSSSTYWLGGTDYDVEGTWVWVTGETWNYTNWSSGQPDNSSGNQDYAGMYLSNGTWDDDTNTTSRPFIIEWESLSDVGTVNALYSIKTISTASQFLEIQNNTSGYYILENNIKVTTWTPVDFSGVLIGNNHTVSGITVNQSSGNAGVFLTVTGLIEDITFDVTISSTSTSTVYVGGAVAYLNGGTLKNITVKGTVTSTSATAYTGGVVGYFSSGTVSGLTNYATVNGSATGTGCTGGVIAHADSVDFSDLINHGNVTGYYDVGGVIGGVVPFYNGGSSATVTNLINYGTVTSSSSGTGSIGGVIGVIYRSVNNSTSYSLIIDGAKNYGDVTATNHLGGVIGYVGLFNSGSGTFVFEGNNLYNEGNITCNGAYAGGLIGYGEVKTNTSYISGTSSAKVSGQYYVGGIAGYLSNIIVKDCSNAGSTVSATSYFTSDGLIFPDKVDYVCLGGYVGYGYSVSGCSNAVNITYSYSALGGCIGGIAGMLSGTISDCSNSGNITASNAGFVGGVCGAIWGMYTGSISGLTNTGTIKGYLCIGGVLGAMYTSVSISADYVLEISDLTNEGDVTAICDVGGVISAICVENTSSGKNIALHMTGLKNSGNVTSCAIVGGLIGYASSDHSSSYLTSSSSSGAVTARSSGNMTETFFVGGLAGYLENVSLTDSSNAGSTVSATSYMALSSGDFVYLGGYVGYGYCVSGCDNAVNISYSYAAQYIGGIAGYLTGTISDCTNSGKITAANAKNVGGIAGLITYAASGVTTMSNLTNTGAVSGAENVGGIFGGMYYNTSASYNTTLSLATFKNSGNITASGNYAGGIAGYIYLENTDNSYTYSLYANDITNTGKITAADYCYGIFGYGEVEASSSVTEYVSKGSIICSGSYYGDTYTGRNITFSN